MDGAAIRKHVGALGPRKRGGRVPPTLRREIADYARQRRSAGVTVSAIARETGVSEESVRRWSSSTEPRPRALVPVHVRGDESAGTGIVLQTAQGHRVTGLDVETAVRVLRMLG